MHAITGILVLKVPPQSIAAEIGMQENDVVLKINEYDITDVSKLQEILIEIEDRDESEIILFRYQKTINIIL
jgi:S1-C subfamily serine protease